MLMFAIILTCWAVVGFVGVKNCKADRVNYEMLVFLGFAPFIPVLAKIFQIL